MVTSMPWSTEANAMSSKTRSKVICSFHGRSRCAANAFSQCKVSLPCGPRRYLYRMSRNVA